MFAKRPLFRSTVADVDLDKDPAWMLDPKDRDLSDASLAKARLHLSTIASTTKRGGAIGTDAAEYVDDPALYDLAVLTRRESDPEREAARKAHAHSTARAFDYDVILAAELEGRLGLAPPPAPKQTSTPSPKTLQRAEDQGARRELWTRLFAELTDGDRRVAWFDANRAPDPEPDEKVLLRSSLLHKRPLPAERKIRLEELAAARARDREAARRARGVTVSDVARAARDRGLKLAPDECGRILGAAGATRVAPACPAAMRAFFDAEARRDPHNPILSKGEVRWVADAVALVQGGDSVDEAARTASDFSPAVPGRRRWIQQALAHLAYQQVVDFETFAATMDASAVCTSESDLARATACFEASQTVALDFVRKYDFVTPLVDALVAREPAPTFTDVAYAYVFGSAEPDTLFGERRQLRATPWPDLGFSSDSSSS